MASSNSFDSFDVHDGYNLRPEYSEKFNYNNPFAIFTMGPTGSGKSTLVNKTIELLYKTRSVPSYNSIILDELIENNNLYKAGVKDIVTRFHCNESMNPGTECDLNNPSTEILDNFYNSYKTTRFGKGNCVQFNSDAADKSCDDLFNEKWESSVRKGENIVIETTGYVIPWWFIKRFKDFNPSVNYNCVFVYSLASFRKLIERNILRAKYSLTKFIENNDNPAPRLPNVSENVFKGVTNAIVNSLITLRNSCLRQGRPRDLACGNNEDRNNLQPVNIINSSGKYTLLIFDNEKKRSKLIYDSRTSDSYMSQKDFKLLLSKYGLLKTQAENDAAAAAAARANVQAGGRRKLKRKKTITRKFYKNKTRKNK
jgi:hypothetical protein